MQYFVTTTAFSTTGTQTITTGFQPVGVRIVMGKKYNVANNVVRYSEGSSDGFGQTCNTFYWDATGGKTDDSIIRIGRLYDRVSGTLTVVMDIEHTAFTATGLTFNVHTTNVNWNVRIEAWG